MDLKQQIEEAWEHRDLLQKPSYREVVEFVIAELDKGRLRVAEPVGADWVVHEWIKKAILLYFQISPFQTYRVDPFEFYDKIPLKAGYERMKVRAVPPATVRYGAYVAPNVVLMPSYVNIGAYVDEGTMVDTWATVGSCAQIGKRVHLSGGVGIGGVLEPLQAQRVIVEDDVFVGRRSIIVEGVRVKRRAVIAANVTLTASTKIIDVTSEEPIIYQGVVPEEAVVVPGTYAKSFPAGTFHVACALIIGRRKAATDAKTALNESLRFFSS